MPCLNHALSKHSWLAVVAVVADVQVVEVEQAVLWTAPAQMPLPWRAVRTQLWWGEVVPEVPEPA